jgi:hypothetical protein
MDQTSEDVGGNSRRAGRIVTRCEGAIGSQYETILARFELR